MGFAERSAAALSSADEAIQVQRIDVREAPPRRGKRFPVYAPFVHVKDAPPGANVKLRFGSPNSDAIDVRPGESYPAGRGQRLVFVDWTQLPGAEVASKRYEIVIMFSYVSLALPVTDRVEVVDAPATGGLTGQYKHSADPPAGTAEQLSTVFVPCSGLMLDAAPANTQGMTWGFSAAITNATNGTGTGAVIWPGQTKIIPVDSPSRIWLNAQNTTDSLSWVLLNPRR